MKKRVLSILGSIMMLCCVFTVSLTDVQAAGNELIQVDGSYLTTEDTSIGKSPESILRGEYLMDGECSISKAGRNRIYVYAATTEMCIRDRYVYYIYFYFH